MEVTMKSDLMIPQVISDMVQGELGRKITLLPVTTTDDSLVGKPGDTLQFPAFRYIGKAEQVDENGQVQAGVLSVDTASATVKKYAKAVRITDEARLSGFGDPVGEAARQLAHAIDHAVDDALFDLLGQVSPSRKAQVAGLSSEAVADGLALFGEEQDGDKILLTDAEGFNALRRDPDYLRGGDLAQQSIFSGAAGEIWGCRIVISSKIKPDSVRLEKKHYIIKPGALRLVNKQGCQVEVQREPEYMRDSIYCSKHCAAYLYDAGKLAALTQYLGLETLETTGGIRVLPAGAGKVKLAIPDDMKAGVNSKWAYILSDNAAHAGVFGSPVAGLKDYADADTEITTGGKTRLHLFLCGMDNKPVKALVLGTAGE